MNVKEEVRKGNWRILQSKEVSLESIDENDIVEGFKNSESFLDKIFFLQEIPNELINKKNAKQLIDICSFVFTHESIKSIADHELIQYTLNKYYEQLKQNKEDQHYNVLNAIPRSEISDEMIYKLMKIDYDVVKDYMMDVKSEEVRKEFIKQSSTIYDNINFTDDELIFYYETHGNYWMDRILKNYKDCPKFIKKYPEFYNKIKNPSTKVKLAYINADYRNIEKIKNPSDNLCLYALGKNKDAINYFSKRSKNIIKKCNELNISVEQSDKMKLLKEKFSVKKIYLVSSNADLCDESNLIFRSVMNGKELEKLLDSNVKLSFGNLEDDEEYLGKDLFSYQEITTEQAKVLSDLEMDDIKSGYWNIY